MGRRTTREAIVKILFQFEFQNDDIDEQLEYFLNNDELIKNVEKDYFIDVVKGVLANKNVIDEWIKADMSEDWSISRLARIDLCILRVCLYEYRIKAEIPLKIVANEAVEIAKKYGTKSSANFVNGLIGGISNHFDDLINEKSELDENNE